MIGAWEPKIDMRSERAREGAENPDKALGTDEHDVVATDKQVDVVTCESAHEQLTIGCEACISIGKEREKSEHALLMNMDGKENDLGLERKKKKNCI